MRNWRAWRSSKAIAIALFALAPAKELSRPVVAPQALNASDDASIAARFD